MKVILMIVCLCGMLFAACYVGVGSDARNLKCIGMYPKKTQVEIQKLYGVEGRRRNGFVVLILNCLVFMVVFYGVGLVVCEGLMWRDFLVLSVIGQCLNLFDLLVIDLWWFKRSKRVRFSKLMGDEWYCDTSMHVGSYVRGVLMFEVVALLVSCIEKVQLVCTWF